MAGSGAGLEAAQGEEARPPELKTRRDLESHFGDWMRKTEDRIGQLTPEKQIPLRKELHEIASDVVRSLGDTRGAELMREPPKTPLYSTEIKAHTVKVGAEELQVSDAAREKLSVGLKAAAVTAGIDPAAIEKRVWSAVPPPPLKNATGSSPTSPKWRHGTSWTLAVIPSAAGRPRSSIPSMRRRQS